MLIYLMNYLSIPVYTLIDKNRRRVIFIVCIQMFFILALRADTLGHDVENYALYYKTWSNYSFDKMISATRIFFNHQVAWGLESGYVWLCWICAKLGLSFHGFLVIHAAICMTGLYKFLKMYAENKPLALAIMISLGVYQTFFYILRQSLAFVILLYSIEAIKERRLWKFGAFICLAMLFHRASIPFILIYFLYNIRITRKTFILLYVFCIGEFFLIRPIYNIFFIPLLKAIGKDGYRLENFQANNMIILMFLMSLFIMLMKDTKKLFENKDYRICFWAMSSALLIETLSLYVPVYSRAAISMFFPFATILFADVVSMQKIHLDRVIWTTIFYPLLFVFYIYRLMTSVLVPYISVF